MTWLEALLLGILQGATEFLPISSSGHLALGQQLLDLREGTLFFDVVVHVATLVAISIVLRHRLLTLLLAGWNFLRRAPADAELREHQRWLGLIAIASVPTALIGLGLKDWTETQLREGTFLGPAFLTTAALLLVGERLGRRNRSGGSMSALDALLIGTAQGLAVIPGISRSGATVSTALVRNIDAENAVDFSLLISLPAVAGAALLTLQDAFSELSSGSLAPLAIGFVMALATGVIAVRALQWATGRRRLFPFALYCATLGGVISLGGFF